jgi:hypothetical protein
MLVQSVNLSRSLGYRTRVLQHDCLLTKVCRRRSALPILLVAAIASGLHRAALYECNSLERLVPQPLFLLGGLLTLGLTGSSLHTLPSLWSASVFETPCAVHVLLVPNPC